MLDTDRPCKEHSFITNVDDVQNMQDGLLQLMREFETGKLSAFGEFQKSHCLGWFTILRSVDHCEVQLISCGGTQVVNNGFTFADQKSKARVDV